MTDISLLGVKIFVSIAVVLCLSYVAENIGARWAGVLSGLPTGSAITLYFLALENGLEFASNSALYNAAGLIAMQMLIFGYYISDRVAPARSTLVANILVSVLTGVSFYLVTIIVISMMDLNPILAAFFSAISFLIFRVAFRNIKHKTIYAKVRLSVAVLLVRSLVSSVIIISVIGLGTVFGAKWAGLFSAFPTTLLPLLVIIHFTYGKEYADGIIRHVPDGLGGLLLYSFAIFFLYPHVGLNSGVIIAFSFVIVYLLFYRLLIIKSA